MDFVEEPLWLVQRVRARPCPPTKQHKQVPVNHQCGPGLGRGVGTWAGKRRGRSGNHTPAQALNGTSFTEVRQHGDSTFEKKEKAEKKAKLEFGAWEESYCQFVSL